MSVIALPENINREHLLKAIERIDREGVPSGAHSSTYDVVYQDKRYPPKLVVSWSNVFANGNEIDRGTFSGGVSHPCFKLLEKNGFNIIKKKDSGEIFNISKEDFLEVIKNSDVINSEDFRIIEIWYYLPKHEATASMLAEKMGYSGFSAANLRLGRIGKKIADYFGIDVKEREGNSPGYWRLLADGRNSSNGFIWTMKKDLQEALESMAGYYTELNRFIVQANEGGLATASYQDEYIGLRVKVSFGQGVQARVPWIGFFRDGQTTMYGIYPVYLYYRSLNCLILAKGKSETKEPPIDWPNTGLMTVKYFLNQQYGQQPERYGSSYVHKAYDLTKPLDESEVEKDLLEIISEYKNLSLATTSLMPEGDMCQARLPKPFILLAGISGTGKTRFVRKQAKKDKSNYEIVAVRPDWHEPSDLLGYVSRIGGNGAHYVVTDVLKFMVKAWKAALNPVQAGELRPLNEIEPFWLCLDEMNLAPVEQYFADYLSVLETRKWQDEKYSCDPILKLGALKEQLGDNGIEKLRKELDIETGNAESDALWSFFESRKGIPLPPNLIVAGTVNMDETTHGFSRKVIDRAFTIDFGKFFPNDYDSFFNQKTRAKKLGFPVISHIKEADMAAAPADSDGKKSIAFLKELNSLLSQTPFELAYRSLNELLLAVVCFRPEDDVQLQAVWDDFLMTKVLPRIEGDTEKLRSGTGAVAGDSLLQQLGALLEEKLPGIWNASRPDLLREKIDGSPLVVDARSKKKLLWMQERLDKNGFTAFWP